MDDAADPVPQTPATRLLGIKQRMSICLLKLEKSPCNGESEILDVDLFGSAATKPQVVKANQRVCCDLADNVKGDSLEVVPPRRWHAT